MQRENLRIARLSQELSQAELANLVGVTCRQIHGYEEGSLTPSAKILKRLAETLDATTDYLLGLVDDPRGHLSYDDLSPVERKLIDAFHDPKRRPIVEFLMHMSGSLVDGDEESPAQFRLDPGGLALN